MLINALDEFRALGIGFVSHQEAIDSTTPMGECLFTIVAAFSQLERSIIVARVRTGIANARAKGKRLGRPTLDLDLDKLISLRRQGLSQQKIAQRLKCGRGTVQRALASMNGAAQKPMGSSPSKPRTIKRKK